MYPVLYEINGVPVYAHGFFLNLAFLVCAFVVFSKYLADRWSTSLVVELTIDSQIVEGDLQPPAHILPYNCTTHAENIYWLYYMVTIPGLPRGDHYVSVKFSTLRVLPDGTGLNFGPGQILENTFKITTR